MELDDWRLAQKRKEFMEKDGILWLVSVFELCYNTVEKSKSIQSVPPDTAATVSGREWQSKLPLNTELSAIHKYYYTVIFAFLQVIIIGVVAGNRCNVFYIERRSVDVVANICSLRFWISHKMLRHGR